MHYDNRVPRACYVCIGRQSDSRRCRASASRQRASRAQPDCHAERAVTAFDVPCHGATCARREHASQGSATYRGPSSSPDVGARGRLPASPSAPMGEARPAPSMTDGGGQVCSVNDGWRGPGLLSRQGVRRGAAQPLQRERALRPGPRSVHGELVALDRHDVERAAVVGCHALALAQVGRAQPLARCEPARHLGRHAARDEHPAVRLEPEREVGGLRAECVDELLTSSIQWCYPHHKLQSKNHDPKY